MGDVERKPNTNRTLELAMFVVGLATGAGIGVATGNLGIGLATGVAFGIAFVGVIAAFRQNSAQGCETPANAPDDSTHS